MPKYKITAPDGRVITVSGPKPPNDSAVQEIFAAVKPAKSSRTPQSTRKAPQESPVAKRRREQFAKKPMLDQFVLGARENIVPTLLGIGRGESEKYMSPEQIAESRAYQKQRGEFHEQSQRGSKPAFFGGLTAEMGVASLGGPAARVSKLTPMIKGGIGGLASATYHGAQEMGKGNDPSLIGGAVETGASILLPGIGSKVAPYLKGSGEKIAQTAFKAGRKVKGQKVMTGQNLENFMDNYLSFKGAIGSEAKIYKQQNILGEEFNKLLQRTKKSGKSVDPLEAVRAAKTRIERLSKTGEINLTQKKKILASLDELGNSMEPLLNKEGRMSFKAAQRFKTNTLDPMAKWDKPPVVGSVDPSLAPPSEASRTVRGKLVQRMSKEDPIFQPLNKKYKEMADVRPFVQQAAERLRANRGLSLQDVAALAAWTIGTGGGNILVKGIPFLVSRGQKSPALAKILYNIGKTGELPNKIPQEIREALMQAVRSSSEKQTNNYLGGNR